MSASTGAGSGAGAGGSKSDAVPLVSASQRETCYSARDAYFNCRVLNEEREETVCAALRRDFEAACPLAWVQHFSKRRAYLQWKSRVKEQGYQQVKP